MALDYSGFQGLLEKYDGIQKSYKEFLQEFMLQQGMRALGIAKSGTPVDSGYLRNHWELSDVMIKGDSVYVILYNNTEYASHVEEGHMQNARWVPGYWKAGKGGSTFVYDPNAKTGMMLKTKWVKGFHMARIATTRIQAALPARYKKAFEEKFQHLV